MDVLEGMNFFKFEFKKKCWFYVFGFCVFDVSIKWNNFII